MRRYSAGRLIGRLLLALDGALFPLEHRPLAGWMESDGSCARCGSRTFAGRPCTVCGARQASSTPVVSLLRRRRKAA